MHLSKLSLLNFKNYEQVDLSFKKGLNCILGDNGEGKTTILDAIYVLSFCKSYFNAIDSHSIRFGEDYFMVQGSFSNKNDEDEITCTVRKGRKKVFKRNKADYDKLSDHIGRYPVVMITPYDSNLILGGSEIRRKFIDSILSQVDKVYLSNLVAYYKVLEQRNALLKSVDYGKSINMELLNLYDDQLIHHGKLIWQTRKSFIESQLIPRFRIMHEALSEGKEEVLLVYESQISDTIYESKFKSSLDKDRATQYTNVGIHKDDLAFVIEGHSIKKFGSQGQQKTYLLALKLAYYEYMLEEMDVEPILMLDDVFDKLDRHRVMALLKLVTNKADGQVFLTDTSANRVPEILTELGKSSNDITIKEGGAIEA